MMTAANPLSSIRDHFFATWDPDGALEGRTVLVDRLVTDACSECLPDGVAVLAVGGYGRRQLFPCSDIDLLLLFESERAAEAAREPISSFLQRLWDSGLRVSQSVRTPAECAELHATNIELNISLLDQRFLAGDRTLHEKLTERLPRFLQSQRNDLIRNLCRMTRERHAKHGDTFYHLEPNIKEHPGGLRDYQLLCWLNQVRSASDDLGELQAARRFLFAVRCYLHYQAARDVNSLTFDAQEEIAERWRKLQAAEWMREYFLHARDTYRAAIRVLEASEARTSSLFAQFRDWRSRLSNADFTVLRERVYFRAPQQLDSDPHLLLRLFQFAARHGIRPGFDAEQRIQSQLPRIAEYFAEPRAVWGAIDEILRLPHAPVALRAMHETGVLRALFPELEQMECLVVRDFYHRYTVDEHTLVAIQTLAQLRGAQGPYADLLSEIERPGLLVFALLFHDVGKGAPADGHVDASVRAADEAMQRIGMPEPERQTVRWLIQRHLDMSATMNARDLFDPATARFLAHRIGTVELLKSLTLMTYCDISAVNPAAMTPWRSEQLWQLYLATYNELTRELETERIQPADAPDATGFLEGFPTRYLRTHSPAEIEVHRRLELSSRARGVATELHKSGAVYRLTLVARDRPFLFASVAGTLSSFGMNILKAEAFANRYGTVLDTFTFADPSRTLELNPTEAERLRTMVEKAILGKTEVAQLLKNRPKPSPPSRKSRLEPSVSFDGEASGVATLIQIVAQDRPGLLYDLSSRISAEGCNIEVVLIDTEAHKAIDVFYVTAGGKKLAAGTQERLKQELLRVCSRE